MRKKKCKAKNCRKWFQPKRSLQVVCDNYECAIEYARQYKAEKKRKAQREVKKVFKGNDKKHQTLLTKKVFNAFIRTLDAGEPCISCGRHKCGAIFDAGHFKSVGSHPELRFDPRNCYIQGSGCNRTGQKRVRNSAVVSVEYEERLRAKMGNELVDWLNGPHPPRHYTIEDLKEIRKLFAAETRYIEKHGRPSRNWRTLDSSVLAA